MEQKRRATELETQDIVAKSDELVRQIHLHRNAVGQLEADNKARREVLEETNGSLAELGNLLQDLKHTTDKMRQLYWE